MHRRTTKTGRHRWFGTIATLSALIATAAVLLGSGAAASATVGSGTHLVAGYLNGLSLATRLGAAPATRAMTIGVEVQRPNTAGELALYDEMYQKGSPEYHHFLTPAQFNQRFGVKPAQADAVRNWLTGGGLKIDTSSDDYFTATGTVSQLDRLLKVNIGDYRYKTQHFAANAAPASVPDSLSVAGIAGLDTINRFTLDNLHGHTLKALAAVARSASSHGAIAAARAIGPQAGDQNEFTPQDLWGIYDDPGASSLTKSDGTSSASALESSKLSLGQGQTIGIFGEGETSSVIAQLRLFEAAMGFPKVSTRVVHTEGGADSAYGDNTGAIEWYLDSQSSTGMAPDVSKLDFYFAKSLFDADILQDFNKWANDASGPKEMDASFGECEENPTNPLTGPLAQQPYGTELGDELEAMGDPLLRQATMEGRTLFSSAGDTGSGCPEVVAPVLGGGNGVAIQPAPFVGYPCDSTYVVCVGGTVVSSNGDTYPTEAQRSAETSWTYSGGGSSHFIPEPGYQTGITNIDLPCETQPDGTPYSGVPPTCRGVPDIADLSGNITGDGYFIYIDGEPSSEGGTSLSSPLMLGQWARVQAAASRGGVGFANPVIYNQAKDADTCTTAPCTGAPAYERDFFDITDSELGAGNGFFQPSGGWDYTSGWGALNIANFVQDVDGTTNAAASAASPEQTAVKVTTAKMTSPKGNATDPADVSLGNEASLDLSGATLTTSSDGKTITATLTGPSLGSNPPADAAGGNTFYVAWEYGGEVYYAQAQQSRTGSFSYSSGNTGTYGKSSSYGYNNTSSSAATGSFNSKSDTITITVPASEVGSPKIGDALTVPQAFDQLDLTPAAESLTTDSSDDLTPISQDGGLADSVGVQVIVGGAPNSSTGPATGTSTGSGSFGGGKTCTVAGGPVVHAKARLTGHLLKASGKASNHGCSGKLVAVGVAVARNVGHKCEFLSKKGKFGKPTTCLPKHFLAVRGTAKWSYQRRQVFSKGVYFLWARATNSRHHSTRTRSHKRIFLRLR
jgi:subtilase family serine protease